MGYAILKDASSIQEKIKELFTVRTRSRRRVILGPLEGLAPLDLFSDVRNVELYSWGEEAQPDAVALAEGITAGEPARAVVAPATSVPAVSEPEFFSREEEPRVAPDRRLARAGPPDAWRHFLEGECWKDEGLLCFYDRPRTRRLVHLCRFYAAWLGCIDTETVGSETPPRRSVIRSCTQIR